MDEIIVRIARGIASPSRLRLLSYLAEHGETTPSRLAHKLGTPLNTLSADLRILSSVGLIRGRKSGAQCYYALVSPYGDQTLSGSMSRWLGRILGPADGKKDHLGLPEVRDDVRRRVLSPLHAAIFDAATAFTDLRRLQILRYLETHAEATAEELVDKLSMSPQAVSRQTSKLRRRGLLSSSSQKGRGFVFRLAGEYKTPVHRRMHEIVRKAWQKG